MNEYGYKWNWNLQKGNKPTSMVPMAKQRTTNHEITAKWKLLHKQLFFQSIRETGIQFWSSFLGNKFA